jgi:hypothetical protein
VQHVWIDSEVEMAGRGLQIQITSESMSSGEWERANSKRELRSKREFSRRQT